MSEVRPEGPFAHDFVLRDYATALRRRWCVILLAVILVPAAALYLSHRERPTYEASADVLLGHDSLAGVVGGVSGGGSTEDPSRVSQTQADLARIPPLAERVIRRTKLRMTPSEFLGDSSVSPRTNSDILTFSVKSGEPALAQRLATAYAMEYTAYRRQLDTAALISARNAAEARVTELKSSGDTHSALYSALVERAQLLATLSTLQASNASLVKPASGAAKVSPRPLRNGLIGFAVGLVLGVGLALLWDTLDTRVRSAEEISSRLQLPLLARLPAPPRRVRSQNRLVTIDQPNSAGAEAFRVLRTNVDLVNLDRKAHTILVTSALEGEGKSTTAANLAVALARSGRHVLLADFDTRKPFIHNFFDLPQESGLTTVAIGRLSLDSALSRVPIEQGLLNRIRRIRDGNENGTPKPEGELQVLTAGPAPPNPGEFAASPVVAGILTSLRERADVVIIDAPPLLNIGDALVFGAQVDALLVVARIHALRRRTLRNLDWVLRACPAAKLGFILASAELEEGEGPGPYALYAPANRVGGELRDEERVR